MLSRLLHAAIAFVVTGGMYLGYMAVVVPVVEPSASAPVVKAPVPGETTKGEEAVAAYQGLLAAYFPKGHWTSQQPPKVFENEQLMLVIADFEQTNQGKIIARRCAMLVFPTPRERGIAPPRDAIIMEPSGGAELEGKRTPGVAAGAFGKLDRAWLRGDVKIHSDMKEPGRQDDLDIITREIYIREDLVRTDERVEMKLGPHWGGGRGLEIKILDTEHQAAEVSGAALVGRFESLEITDEVSFEVVPAELSLPGDDAPPAAAGAKRGPEPPMHIKSSGPFRIDFASYVASFTELVHVEQIQLDGKLDTLDADELKLYFREVKKKKKAAKASSSPLGAGFELATLEATGDPVVINAPGREAAANCRRIRLDLKQQLATVNGLPNAPAALMFRGAEIQAPLVQYTHPRRESGRTLGDLVAAGSGFLKAVVDRRRPSELLDVAWTESLRIERKDGGAPVLVINGRPRLSLGSTGKMWSDTLELTLLERPTTPAEAASSPLPWAVAPDRLRAVGNVAIDSPELVARVDRLQLDVKYPPPPRELGLNAPDGSAAPAQPATAGATENRTPPVNPLMRLNRAARRTYRVTGEKLALGATVHDGKTDVSSVAVEGGVLFEEVPSANAKQAPLQVKAERVVVADADTASAKIDIFGQPNAADHEAQHATISAQGATLCAPQISIVRGRSQVQIESPGEVQLVSDRDLTGKQLARPEPITITWQKWMRLDGDRLTFHGDVLCRNAAGWLSTRQLGVQLSQAVTFDGAGGANRTDVDQVDCSDGVVAEFDERDDAGITSHQRLELASILVNQRTGVIGGEGPGSIDSVHLASGKGMFTAGAPGLAQPGAAPSADQSGQKLRHLHVDFARGVEGNLNNRVVTLVGDVQATYGPVDAWEQRLARRIGSGPGANVVWLDSDRLTVAESPVARASRPAGSSGLAELELTAQGRVKIEGEVPGRGLFAATAGRASYDAFKGVFLLEWDGAVPAKIYQQQAPGAPPGENEARKMMYFLRTGEVREEGVNKIEWNQFDLGRTPAGTQQR